MENSNLVPNPTAKWAINVDRLIVEIPKVIIEEIRAHPTRPMGWFNAKLLKAWKLLFPLTLTSAVLGFLPLLDSAWGTMEEPSWKFHSDTPGVEEANKLVWNNIPQISPMPILCEVLSEESCLREGCWKIKPLRQPSWATDML